MYPTSSGYILVSRGFQIIMALHLREFNTIGYGKGQPHNAENRPT